MLLKSLFTLVISLLLTAAPAHALAKRVFVTDPFPPYYYMEDGRLQGIQYELAALAFKKLGVDFDIKFLPWKRALVTARSRTVDGVFGLRRTKERERWLIYPDEPLMTVKTVIFHRADADFNYTGINSLSGKTVGIINGYTYGDQFDQSTAFTKEPVKSLILNFLKLEAGRIDLVAAYLIVGMHTLERMGLSDRISFCSTPIQCMPLYLAFTAEPGNGSFAAKFSRALKEVKHSQECVRIMNRLNIDGEIHSPCNE